MSSVHDSAASQPNTDTDATEVSHLWTKLKSAIKEILNAGKADFRLYTSVYTVVFNCCTSANHDVQCPGTSPVEEEALD